jgi:hypothetical protein
MENIDIINDEIIIVDDVITDKNLEEYIEK